MKYRINYYGNLIIDNDSGDQLFGINKDNNWFKSDRDHNGKEKYYEDSDGYIINYDDEI